MFYLDDAGTNKTEDFNWWLDGHGNIIAVTTIDRTGYAVLKDLIWIDGTPGYAQATLINMDGTEYTATVTSIDGDENYEPDTVANFNWDAIDTSSPCLIPLGPARSMLLRMKPMFLPIATTTEPMRAMLCIRYTPTMTALWS